MSNTICIKHGIKQPEVGILKPFELGYVTSTGTLVIGDASSYARKLNYLQTDTNGRLSGIRVDNDFIISCKDQAQDINLILNFEEGNENEISYSMNKDGRGFIREWNPKSSYYETYFFPIPDATNASKNYDILTSKGGAFGGDFTFNNGVIIGSSNFDSVAPDSSLGGKQGQLYFQIINDGTDNPWKKANVWIRTVNSESN